MVCPAQRRYAAESVVAVGLYSRRWACCCLGLARSTWSYRQPPTERRVEAATAIVAAAGIRAMAIDVCTHWWFAKGCSVPDGRCRGSGTAQG